MHISEEAIRTRAYYIYLERLEDGVYGDAEGDWHWARDELELDNDIEEIFQKWMSSRYSWVKQCFKLEKQIGKGV